MIALWASLALAQVPPRHHQVDLTLGMRAGAAAQVTVEAWPHIELGGRLHGETDVYAGAPGWVRTGLNPGHNLHLTPTALIGVNTGDTPVSGAFLIGPGLELFSFREQKTVPALATPVEYGATALRPAGALTLDLRVRSKAGPGGHLLCAVPLPLTPSGTPYCSLRNAWYW